MWILFHMSNLIYTKIIWSNKLDVAELRFSYNLQILNETVKGTFIACQFISEFGG